MRLSRWLVLVVCAGVLVSLLVVALFADKAEAGRAGALRKMNHRISVLSDKVDHLSDKVATYDDWIVDLRNKEAENWEAISDLREGHDRTQLLLFEHLQDYRDLYGTCDGKPAIFVRGTDVFGHEIEEVTC